MLKPTGKIVEDPRYKYCTMNYLTKYKGIKETFNGETDGYHLNIRVKPVVTQNETI